MNVARRVRVSPKRGERTGLYARSGLLILLAMGLPLNAASLEGKIYDTSKALLPGVEVSLLGDASEPLAVTLSDALGAFTFSNINPGTYKLKASLPGFKEKELGGIALSSEEERTFELILEVETSDEKVEVDAPESEIERLPAALDTTLRAPQIPEPNEIFVRTDRELFLRGRIYSDWFVSSADSQVSQQLSNRVRVELGRPPGEGWTVRLDLRDRHRLGGRSQTRVALYDARLTFDSQENPLFLSLGQMNLYDTAGIGQLLGATAGFKLNPHLLLGGYAGYSPNLSDLNLDRGYSKYGFFARFTGSNALNLSLSLNELRYRGQSERRFLYLNGLTPVGRKMTLYGNLDYELGSNVNASDRISRLFLNSRVQLTDHIDLSTHFSSGKGLDYHRYLLEQSQELLPINSSLDRFFFTTQYGVRVRFKLPKGVHIYLGQRESTEKDKQVRNHTTQLGLSAQDIGGSGLSANLGYNLNRGDRSESSSLYLAISRTFGRYSWNFNYSNSLNSVRIDPATGQPQLVHFDDLHTVSNNLFIVLSRTFAISVEYERSFGRSIEDLFFFRFIYRM